MLHKTREQLIKVRTMNVNALRGHPSEFGVIAAKGIERVKGLVEKATSDARRRSSAFTRKTRRASSPMAFPA